MSSCLKSLTHTAALIVFFSSHHTLTGRLLSTKPLVQLGLISYSAYLWHQPLFAFTRLRSIKDPVSIELLPQILISIALAYISWRYVETYFRDRMLVNQKSIFWFGIVSSFVFIVIGKTGEYSNGFENRITDEQKQIMAFESYDVDAIYRKELCLLSRDQKGADFSTICFPAKPNDETILVWGDSHAAALSYGIRELYPNIIQMTAAGCRPMLDINNDSRAYCSDINRYVLDKIHALEPGYIILHANWSGEISEADTGSQQALLDTILSIKSISPRIKIIIVGGVPQWKPSLPTVLLRLHLALSDEAYVFSNKYDDIQISDRVLLKTAQESHIVFVSLLDMLCREKNCLSSVKYNNIYEPFAWDYGHLSKSGSVFVSSKLLEILITPSP